MHRFAPRLLAVALLVPGMAYAGAWTQETGASQLIVTGLYYSADELYNNQGNRVSQSRYTKYELNPYFEYGLTDAITVGTNLSFQRADQSSQENWGVGDSEFFARFRLHHEGGLVISAEPMLKLPSPEGSNETPQLGGRHPDIGAGISVGYGFEAWGRNHFVNLDSQYRVRLGDPENQVKIAATAGLSADDRWMLMPQLFLTQRSDDPAVSNFTQSSGDDYNLLKLQLTAVYKLNEDTSLQCGAFSHADGKNVGAGSGLLLAVWNKF